MIDYVDVAEFDVSLELSSAGPLVYTALADPRREATTGMFGGWTAALLLKAVLTDAPDEGAPVSLTVHFLSVITPGRQVTVTTRRVGGSRAIATWQAELHAEGTESACAIATVVLAKRRESLGFTDFAMPQVPPPEGLFVFHPPGPFGERTDIRPVHGFPPFNQSDSRVVFWMRETSGRAVDRLLLAYLADNFPPRSWSRRTEPGPYSTLTLSAYLHATDAELAAVGDDDVLLEAQASRAESSTVAAHARVWSRSGALLMTTEQLGWFR